MGVLSAAQRKFLSDTVAEARDVLEAACAQRITSLGVAQERVPEYLTDDERSLRRALRARARQLGSVDSLAGEAAFEHWHRMLFARYLADNHLLVDDQTSQAVSIEEIAEYAAELGESDMWEIAARFAAAMLPGIFRQDDPALQMRLPVETRQRLEELLGSLSADVITADDSLGWVYQYWQSRRKDDVNRSESKIEGTDLSPLTQLFTEHYMVRFLLENSLGAWWAARHPESPLLADWEFLRHDERGNPVAGTFDSWPSESALLTVMDPCCGSGHFIVAAFDMLWRMRSEESNLSPVEAQDAVLRENVFGLELDPRCTQIATFALALEAWKAGGYRTLPIPQVACSGIPAKAPLSSWTELAEGQEQLENGLARLHALFVNADTFGSLIDPIRTAEEAGLQSVDWHDTAPILQSALARDKAANGDPAAAVFGEAAAGIARAADLLTRSYTLIATNVPFLLSRRHSALLDSHLSQYYRESRADLATAMLQRCMGLMGDGSTWATVSPTSWLQLRSYRDFRQQLLTAYRIDFLSRLGPGAFEGISGEIVNVVLSIVSKEPPESEHCYISVDVSDAVTPSGKRDELRTKRPVLIKQKAALASRDSRLLTDAQDDLPLLSEYFWAYKGLTTGDDPRHRRHFWELPGIDSPWSRIQSTPDGRDISGCSGLVALGVMTNPLLPGVEMRGEDIWGRQGIHVKQMQDLQASLYLGYPHDQNAAAIIARDDSMLPALWAFIKSGEYSRAVRAVDGSLKVTNATLVQVPFDLERWRKVAAEDYPDGLPEPYSDDPTQWLFSGQADRSTQPLQVAVARLLGYSWPEQDNADLGELEDADGVVCLPAVGGELPAAERLLRVLATIFGRQWSPQILDTLLAEAGARPGTDGLSGWLRNGYFKQHCKVFSNRPFIWQIWDGLPDGFSVLVNYHKLDRKLLERLTYDYLGSWWLSRVRSDVDKEVVGAERRLAAGEELKKKLGAILDGEAPLDIYIRWKSLSQQPIGWEPDLDDGVRLNIRPFITAGVLRHTPVLNWKKDRGKNPDGSDRENDLHFSLAEKRSARGQS